MQRPRFIHLRNHSEYSLLEGALRLKSIPKLCKDHGFPAIALTDTNNLFGALEFSEVMAANGIQPIIGAEFQFLDKSGEYTPDTAAPLVFLAQNHQGYLNLLKLSSHYYLKVQGERTPLDFETLREHSEGLICLTGGAKGAVGILIQNEQFDAARHAIERLNSLFPNRLYIEIERHPENGAAKTDEEAATEPYFLHLAYTLNLPIVATNNCHFTKEDDQAAHDALICIGDGAYVDQPTPRRHFTTSHHFKSSAEMVALFADLPEAVDATIEIAKRCAFKVEKHAPILPKFANDEVETLRSLAKKGLADRLAVIEHAAPVEDYEKRLDYELGVIEGMGFPGYFLIVADFIQWAKQKNIPVGPGRGSGAGSLVAYALTITDLDPLRFSLLFERFLNPERVSMPDFDIDFCMDRREEVIQYVQEKYGRDRVAQIITFGALLSKAAIRDVGRVLQMPYGQVDRLSKLIPVEGVKPVSIAKALTDEPRLGEEARKEEVVGRLLEIAENVEGLLRNASTHAAGIVIGDRPLDELVPLYQDPRSDMPATQFNMKRVEDAGLVKFDFLGLKTLTVIQNAVDLLKKRGVELDINHIPLDDKKTYELYASAHTAAVFQVESAGMRDALKQLKPNTIEDIVALVALYRPGPMENIPKFCKVKNKIEERERLHPLIDHILDETQGIIVYQEQVMEIAREMAGYSLGGADLLRRAMGKKIKEAMDAERPKFVEGAKANGVDTKKAEEVFALLEKFANYGFNKSHAAAYAIVSYQTAYLKANYPVEFMAAVMNGDLHLTDKLSVYKRECDRMGIAVEPVSINSSEARFDVKDGKILYAMGALKNVGPEAVGLIATERHENGKFNSIFEFARRVELKKIGKRSLENLAKSGSFDCVDRNRQKMLANLETLINYSDTVRRDVDSDQNSLFSDISDSIPEPRLVPIDRLLPSAELREEHQAIGFYLSGHPLESYRGALKRKKILTLAELEEKAQQGAFAGRVAATVSGRQERKSARGNRFAFVQLSDPTGLFEVMVFSEPLDQYRDLLEPGQNIVMTVEVSGDSDNMRANLRAAQAIEAVIDQNTYYDIDVHIRDEIGITQLVAFFDRIKDDTKIRTRGRVRLVIPKPDFSGEVILRLENEYPLNPEVIAAIKSLDGITDVQQ